MKKKIKIFVSVVLLFSFIFSISLNINAEESTKAITNDENNNAEDSEFLKPEETALLSYLNVMDCSLDDENAPVTRRELAIYLAAALGLREEAAQSSSKMYFDDVSKKDSAIGYINILTERGIFYPDDNFRPDDYATFTELCTVLSRALGYDVAASSYGGFSQGYLKTAAESGILKGSKADDGTVTKQTVGKMIYNAWFSNVMEYERIAGGYAFKKVSVSKTKTLIYKLFKIYKIKGIITATKYTSLTNPKGCPDEIIEIDGVEYINSGYDGNVGYKAIAYIKDLDDPEAVCITTDGLNGVKEFDGCDMISHSFDRQNVSFSANGKTSNLRVDKYADFIYNGKSDPNFDFDEVNSNTQISFIDNDNDGYYEVVYIWKYIDCNVLTVDANDMIIIDKNNQSMCFEEYDDVIVINETGNKGSFKNIKQEMIASVFLSKDNLLAWIYLEKESPTGNVTSINNSDDECRVSIDGQEYKLTEAYRSIYEAKKNWAVGDFIKAKLNYRGLITDVEISSNSGTYYGFIMRINVNDETDECKARIFTQNDDFELIKMQEKIKLNDITTKSVDVKSDPVFKGDIVDNEVKFVPQMIKYIINLNGEISHIYTEENRIPEIPKGKGLYYNENITSARYREGIFGSKYIVNSNTSFFGIPTPKKDGTYNEADFRVMSLGTFVVNDYYNVKFYDSTETHFAGLVVTNPIDGDIAEYEDEPVFVNSITKIYDSGEGEIRNAIVGLHNGAECRYIISDESENVPEIKQGDVISILLDSQGEITKAKIGFRYERDLGKYGGTTLSREGSTSEGDRLRLSYGKVRCLDSNNISISYGDDSNIFANPYRGRIYVYDSKKNKFENGDKADITVGGEIIEFKKWDVLKGICALK